MELEYRDDRRRGRFVVVLGVVLAVLAGGAAYYFVSQAQQQAGRSSLSQVAAVVAVKAIPARQPIAAGDVEVRQVPIDPTNAAGIASDPTEVIGRIPAVTILQGQLVTTNMLASNSQGDLFSILGPDETVAPDSVAWRAVSMTVCDDLAVGGLVKAGSTVDVFVTAIVQVPLDLVNKGRYYTDRSTKITYQDMQILARSGSLYIVKAPLPVAEEITHMQATGTVTFGFALRPDIDTRITDASGLGETTNRIITKYGLPIPETYPAGNGPISTLAPIPSATPTPSPTPAASPSPAAPSPSP